MKNSKIKVYRENDSYIPSTIVDVFKTGLSDVSSVLITHIKSNFKSLHQIGYNLKFETIFT